jgi:phosphoserine phosphatase
VKTKSILVTISGADHPGITSEFSECLMLPYIKLIDIGQSITHGLLSLSFLFEITDLNEEKNLKNKLSQKAQQLEMKLEFKTIINRHEVHYAGEKYILSCVAQAGITSEFLHDISSILAKNDINIQRIDNVSSSDFTSLEIQTVAHSLEVKWEKVKPQLINISNKHSTDMAMLKDNVWRRNKRLIVFDMDSTLIQKEVIVEMAKVYGVGEQVHKITEAAMNGEIDFDESLVKRVALLKGMPEAKLKNILDEIPLTDGVEEFIMTVKKLGYKTAIISGGFSYFANAFKEKLSIDYAFANDLEISKNILTGKVAGPIVNAEKKAMFLELLAQQENIKLEQVVAIGDGANDLPMLAKAGLGIAFHAKDIVKQNAQQHMSHGPMTSILHFLGITEKIG